MILGNHTQRWGALICLLGLLLIGCSKGSQGRHAGPVGTSSSEPETTGRVIPAAGERAMDFKLTSGAFQNGKPIPEQYTGDGNDISPPLMWEGVPEDAQELALICDDPDAPTTEPWVHWVMYKIPRDATGLPEGVPRSERLDQPAGALQGTNSWPSGNIGYRGPKPPSGEHRYFFRLYALDKPVTLPPKATKEVLLNAMEGRIIAEAMLMGTYRHK